MFDHNVILSQIRELYCGDNIPWVIGFSGGKDSTTVLQMLFYALSALPKQELSKPIHVLCNDTLVENPAIIEYVDRQLEKIETAGKGELFSHAPELFSVVKVEPKLEDRFWANLIGKGYPSPNRWFRWCTRRLKIKPTSDYILSTVSEYGHAIIVLGTRKAESANRAAAMKNYDSGQCLRKHTLPNAFVYAPIADLSNNEVWAYLLQSPNPWSSNNKELYRLYSNACDGGECPFVIETGTQSCGKSRFGCWVCTVVRRDISMENLIDNGEEWMEELLDYRNWLYDIRQQTNQTGFEDLGTNAKFGPFLLGTRREMLDRLLNIQDRVSVELISLKEVHYIRDILERDSEEQVSETLREFIFELPNGKSLVTVSDFDITLSTRERLGSIHLKQAKLIETRSMCSDRLTPTRVMYYCHENGYS